MHSIVPRIQEPFDHNFCKCIEDINAESVLWAMAQMEGRYLGGGVLPNSTEGFHGTLVRDRLVVDLPKESDDAQCPSPLAVFF